MPQNLKNLIEKYQNFEVGKDTLDRYAFHRKYVLKIEDK